MLLTEEQARTKWCPHARTVEATGVGSSSPRNRVTRPYDSPPLDAASRLRGCACIASECMAWRWEPADAFEARKDAYHDAANIGGLNVIEEPQPRGFCGLAGKVEG